MRKKYLHIIIVLLGILLYAGTAVHALQCEHVNKDQIKCDDGELFTIGDHLEQPMTTGFWVDIGVVAGLVLLAGLMSGLTMGLMSLDTLNLNIIKNSGSEKDSKCAATILPLVEKHHLLLVTLLLTNAAASEALPIFLDRLVHPAVAIAMSVTLVLLFGEIIPQAVCTRYGLRIGAAMAWFVWMMIGLLFVVAWPIAKLLDILLGKETGTFFRRTELKELVHLHAEDINNHGESLSGDEVRIIKGAIDMKEKTVDECQTPAEDVFAISIDTKLDRDTLQKIVNAGHYRIPVYHTARDHFIGMILTKDLILLDPNDATPVRNLPLYKVPIVTGDMPLYDMLHQFQTGRSHMAIVLDPKDHINPTGIITLEDVLEELLQEEILDENDYRKNQEEQAIARDLKIAQAFHRKYSVVGGGKPGDGPRRASVAVVGNNEPLRRSTPAYTMTPAINNPIDSTLPNNTSRNSNRGRQGSIVTFDKAALEHDKSKQLVTHTSPYHQQQQQQHATKPPLAAHMPPLYVSPSINSNITEKTPILKKSGTGVQ